MTAKIISPQIFFMLVTLFLATQALAGDGSSGSSKLECSTDRGSYSNIHARRLLNVHVVSSRGGGGHGVGGSHGSGGHGIGGSHGDFRSGPRAGNFGGNFGHSRSCSGVNMLPAGGGILLFYATYLFLVCFF